jgi:hypothetical protein
MNIIRIIIRNTSILYVFDNIKLDSFSNMFGQTLCNLTLTKPRMQDKKRQSEYVYTELTPRHMLFMLAHAYPVMFC